LIIVPEPEEEPAVPANRVPRIRCRDVDPTPSAQPTTLPSNAVTALSPNTIEIPPPTASIHLTPPEMVTIIEGARKLLTYIRIFPAPFNTVFDRDMYLECLWLVAHKVARPRDRNELVALYNERFRKLTTPFNIGELMERSSVVLHLPQLWTWKQRTDLDPSILHSCNNLWFAMHGTDTPLNTLVEQWTGGDRRRFSNVTFFAHVSLRPLTMVLPSPPKGISEYDLAEYQGIVQAEYGMVPLSTTLHQFRLTVNEYHQRRRHWKIVNLLTWTQNLDIARKEMREITPDDARRIMDIICLLRNNGAGKENAMKTLGVTTDQELAERLAQDGLTIPRRWRCHEAPEEDSDNGASKDQPFIGRSSLIPF